MTSPTWGTAPDWIGSDDLGIRPPSSGTGAPKDESGPNVPADFALHAKSSGVVVLLKPVSARARTWAAENLSDTIQRGDAFPIEANHALAIVDGLLADGLRRKSSQEIEIALIKYA